MGILLIVIIAALAFAAGFAIGRAKGGNGAAPSPADQKAIEAAAQTADQLHAAQVNLAAAQATSEGLKNQLDQALHELSDAKAAEERRVAAAQAEEQRRVQAAQEMERKRARQALDEQAQRKNEQSQLMSAFAPVQKNLDALSQRVAAMEESRKQEMGALSEGIRTLGDTQRALSTQTTALATALKDNKVRGAWGEAQLRNIVESAGLLEHVDFDVQVAIEGEGRPDMLIHLPGGKVIPIDAKAPYSDYQRACEIPDTGDEAQANQKKVLLASHAKALKAHVTELGKRDYSKQINTDGKEGAAPDFTIAFIPSESFLQAAMEADPSLMDYAFSQKVALCSPVTLWAVLKSVSYAWQQQNFTDEAEKLFKVARDIYDRMVTLGDKANKLGKSISSSVVAYNGLVATLEGSVLPAARKMEKIDMSKAIPEVKPLEDEKKSVVRTIVAPELTAAASGAEGTE